MEILCVGWIAKMERIIPVTRPGQRNLKKKKLPKRESEGYAQSV